MRSCSSAASMNSASISFGGTLFLKEVGVEVESVSLKICNIVGSVWSLSRCLKNLVMDLLYCSVDRSSVHVMTCAVVSLQL